MERRGYLIVPANRTGMVTMMAGEGDAEDLRFFPFTQDEMAAAFPVMQAFEDAFGFDSRGNTVEQLIDMRFADVAEDIARRYASGATGETARNAALHIAEALAYAQEVGSYVEFDFG